MKDINLKPLFGILIAVIAGVSACTTELDNQRKDRELKELNDRVSKLESEET